MEKLHQSQVKAYHEAAMKSVKEWASSFPLQPMEEGDTKISFVNRCIASTVMTANTMPNWKLENAKVTARQRETFLLPQWLGSDGQKQREEGHPPHRLE